MDARQQGSEPGQRVSSPKELKEYLRVITPGVWMILTVIIVLLGGMIAFSAMTTLESSVVGRGKAVQDNPAWDMLVELPEGQAERVKSEMPVRAGGSTGRVLYTFEEGKKTYAAVEMDKDARPLAGGEYEAVIKVEDIRPIRFLWN